eukprot:2930140-Ditylum_brightwellii.AAC.1
MSHNVDSAPEGAATFNLKSALKKHKEHELETWVLFITFVKRDVIGPTLFIINMVAMLISWKEKEDQSICLFRTIDDNILTGCCFNTVQGIEKF